MIGPKTAASASNRESTNGDSANGDATKYDWTEHDTHAYTRFLGAARGFWARDLYQSVRRQAPEAAGKERAAEIAAAVRQSTEHRYFAWMERHLQRMRYSGPFGLVSAAGRERTALLEALSAPLPDGLLRLDPSLQAPDYYRAYDIHQHPGGLAGDDLAGIVYRNATGSGVVGKPGLHQRFARLATAGRTLRRVLDVGCGFGRATHAFAEAAPGAQVEGIDLSAPCLRVAAHATPEPLRSRVRFAQADAAASGLPSGSYDLVTSTMLLHEMTEAAVRALIAESARLLAPGGAVAHLDFLPPEDPVLRLMFEGHAKRNNEPYLLEHSRIDLEDAYHKAGFRSVSVVDFAEEDGALDPAVPVWRFPWKMIVAEK